MKIKLLTTTLLLTTMPLLAVAEITPSEATSYEYLQNHGHSDAIIEMVQMTKAGANGEEYVTKDNLKHANDNKFVKFVRNFFIYFDPALDDGSFMRHNSNPNPQYDDL